MTEAKPLRVLIAGGGIGGLAAAVAFRLQGHEVEVLELSCLYCRPPARAEVTYAERCMTNQTTDSSPLGIRKVQPEHGTQQCCLQCAQLHGCPRSSGCRSWEDRRRVKPRGMYGAPHGNMCPYSARSNQMWWLVQVHQCRRKPRTYRDIARGGQDTMGGRTCSKPPFPPMHETASSHNLLRVGMVSDHAGRFAQRPQATSHVPRRGGTASQDPHGVRRPQRRLHGCDYHHRRRHHRARRPCGGRGRRSLADTGKRARA